MSVRITAMSDHHHDHDEHQHAGHELGAQAHHHHADAGTRLVWALLLTEPAVDDLPELLALLRECGLPHGDVTADKLAEFLVCRAEGRLIATAGLEVCGDAVLLRSLAVLPGYRQRGLASRLLEALQQRTRARRQKRIFLLTTTAQEFFAARGFGRCARQLVPPGIADTAEFRELCPVSATCMHQQLDDQVLP